MSTVMLSGDKTTNTEPIDAPPGDGNVPAIHDHESELADLIDALRSTGNSFDQAVRGLSAWPDIPALLHAVGTAAAVASRAIEAAPTHQARGILGPYLGEVRVPNWRDQRQFRECVRLLWMCGRGPHLPETLRVACALPPSVKYAVLQRLQGRVTSAHLEPAFSDPAIEPLAWQLVQFQPSLANLDSLRAGLRAHPEDTQRILRLVRMLGRQAFAASGATREMPLTLPRRTRSDREFADWAWPVFDFLKTEFGIEPRQQVAEMLRTLAWDEAVRDNEVAALTVLDGRERRFAAWTRDLQVTLEQRLGCSEAVASGILRTAESTSRSAMDQGKTVDGGALEVISRHPYLLPDSAVWDWMAWLAEEVRQTCKSSTRRR